MIKLIDLLVINAVVGFVSGVLSVLIALFTHFNDISLMNILLLLITPLFHVIGFCLSTLISYPVLKKIKYKIELKTDV